MAPRGKLYAQFRVWHKLNATVTHVCRRLNTYNPFMCVIRGRGRALVYGMEVGKGQSLDTAIPTNRNPQATVRYGDTSNDVEACAFCDRVYIGGVLRDWSFSRDFNV
jgi:hypothetical protein